MNDALELLNRDLVETRERVRRADQLRSRLRHVQEDLWAERKRLEPLRAAMNREAADVRRLEGLGLTALFYTMLGSKEQQIQKERQEALAAKLKHDESAFAVDALADEELRCKRELEGVVEAEKRYEELLNAKEKVVLGLGKEMSERLVALCNRVGGSRADLREIAEAHAAGIEARTSLDVIIERLQKAEAWGSWDMWGGGLLSTSIKHSHLDGATAEAHRVQQQLRTFGRELKDVGEKLEASLEIGEFMKFADYFFDGLIVDWMVQDRIQNALKAATDVAAKVRRVVDRLELRQIEARDRLKRAEADHKDFLEKS